MTEHDSLTYKARQQLEMFLQDCRIRHFEGKKLLEIGFKNGFFLNESQAAGIDAYGLEINDGYHRRASEKFPQLNLMLYDGVNIPASEGEFDYVVSFQVLEHVASVEKVLAECLRVLRPGGIMYHVLPNYHSFYEGHYNVIWLPFLNKTTGRAYLKLLGKYTPFYETLNILKPGILKRLLAAHQDVIAAYSLGKEAFAARFTEENADKINLKSLRSLVKAVLNCGFCKAIMLKTLLCTGFYYPITLIVYTASD